MQPGGATVGHPVDVATGAVYTKPRDISIHGKVELGWERHYSTALLDAPPTALGPGWTTRYFATLTRDATGFALGMPQGGIDVFADPTGSVERGAIVRNVSSFQELARRGDRYVVTRWDVESGRVERYVFLAGRRGDAWPLAAIEDATGQGLDLLRDAAGRLTGIRQRLERRTLRIGYDRTGLIEAVSFLHPDGRTEPLVRYEHDRAGRLTAAYDAAGCPDRYEYDETARLTREILKDGGAFSFRYDARGRCVRTSGIDGYDEKSLKFLDAIGWTEVTDSRGNVTRYQWNGIGQVLSVMTPLGARTRTEYDEHGRIVGEIDANGASTRYEYDEAGNRRAVLRPLGRVTAYEFDENHLPITAIDPAGNVWKRWYDAACRPIASEDPLGGRWEYAYDADGNLVQITDAKGAQRRRTFSGDGVLLAQTDWEGHTTQYTSDHFGRCIERRNPLGEATRTAYDHMGNPVAISLPDGSLARYRYDCLGNLIGKTDANGFTNSYRYGTGGRLLERTDPLRRVVRYRWGSEPGHLEAIVNERHEIHTIARDAEGRIVCEQGFDGRELRFRYDAAGNCVAATNGLGEETTYVIDALGQLTMKVLPDGGTVSFTYDVCGNPVAATNASHAITFERDALGRVIREVQDGYTLEREWDAIGNPTRLETSAGYTVDYAFDRNSSTSSLTLNGRTRIAFERDALGAEVTRALPGGVELRQRFGPMSQLAAQRVTLPARRAPSIAYHLHDSAVGAFAPALVERAYRYDAAGQLTSLEDHRWGEARYLYDPAQRLIQALRETGTSERFDYDITSNIITIASTLAEQSAIEALEYAPGNRLVRQGRARFSYDGNGRRIARVEERDGEPMEWRYVWDSEDQLVSVTDPGGAEWRYTYDAFGRRLSKTGPETSTRYVWDQDVVVHEIERDAPMSSWAFEPRGFQPLYKLQGGAGFAVVCDHLGTPRELVDARGTIAWTASYTAWGERDRTAANQIDCPIRFKGQWHDPESGLSYGRFRYYDPDNGQFLSPDPAGLRGGLNLYRYVRNPVNWVDPFGLTEDDACLAKKAEEDAKRDMRADDRNLSAHDKEFYGGDGTIYLVPGSGTPSGKPYVGSADDLGVRAATATDNRDRSQAVPIGSYPIGDIPARKLAEQQAIDDNGGLKNLDNKRNEIKKK